MLSLLYNFPFHRDAGNLSQAQTFAMNSVCEFRFSSQNIFDQWKCARNGKLPLSCNYVQGKSNLSLCFLIFCCLLLHCVEFELRTVYAVYSVQTEWQSSSWTQSCRFIAEKGSMRITKLPVLCNSVHSNSYTKTKPRNFSSTAIWFLVVPSCMRLALNIKGEYYPPFKHVLSSHTAIATPISISVKWIEPLCLSDSSRMHYLLDNTNH